MILNYKLDEDDFLTHQLFIASKSERIIKKRQRSKIIVPLIYIALGLFAYSKDDEILAFVFFIFSTLWFFIYPFYEKRRYANHYISFIKENYKERLGRNCTLEITNDYIKAIDNGGELKVLTTELEEIYEIHTTLFIRLNGGQSFILPKNKIDEISELKIRLQELAAYLKINYVVDENWEWK
jgi:hypothetical protein